jgi:hypothetical protein
MNYKTSISNQKRQLTNLRKYGHIAPYTKQQHSQSIKLSHDKILDKLNNISIDQLYSKDKINELLNSNKLHFKKYIGKAKNRTMINDDIVLYKSLLYHTAFIDENKLYGEYHIPLSLRLLVAGSLNFKLDDSHYCLCKKTISFDHKKLDFSKNYCKNCLLPRNSKEHFKVIYGIEWEKYYILNCQKIRLGARYGGRMRIYHDLKRHKKIYCPNIGKNETILLDKQELIDNCKIDRNVLVNGYVTDGYCKTTNTVYEVYESYHRYQKEYDESRMNEIKKQLNCEFKIIYDNWDGKYYENKKQQEISNLYT